MVLSPLFDQAGLLFPSGPASLALKGDLAGWFVYPLTMTLAGTIGATDIDQVQVYQNADFKVIQVQFFDTGSNNGQFSVKWGTSNLFFMPTAVLVPNIFGQGNLVHTLPEPVIFPRGSIIAVELTNETANARTIYLAFEGININL
jgi:hypothetical protein